jgi:drug/metabolite transporter (DMT)-like permease
LKTRPTAGDWALLLTLVLIWGTSFMLTKIAVATVPPATVVAGRLAISAGVLLALLRAAGLTLPAGRRIWLHFLALAVVGNALPFFLISWGQERIDSGLAGILMAVMPIATLVLAHFLVPGDRLTWGRSAGFLLGFAGIVILTGPAALGELGGNRGTFGRQLAVLGGALCYAANTIIARRLPPLNVMVVTAAVMAAASAAMIPVAIAADAPWHPPEPLSVAAVAWLGLVSTALANVVYFRLIASAGPTFLSQINYLIPVVALVAGIVLLGEKPEARAFLALGLVLSGLVLAQRR